MISKPEKLPLPHPLQTRAQPVHLVHGIVVHERRAHDTLETGRRDQAGREELAAAHGNIHGAAPFNNSLRRYRRVDERDRR